MASYRVYIAAPTTRKHHWDWQETVIAADERGAEAQAYANWAASRAPRPTPPLKQCRTEVRKVGRSQLLRSADKAESGKQAFIDEIQRQTAQLLATKLDGEFSVVSYPAGFNYGITYGPNAYWNGATMSDINTLLGVSSSGQLELTGGGFSDFYVQLMQGVTFSFSQADEQLMDAQDKAASAQIASVLTEFENAGGVYKDPLPFGGKLQDVFDQLTARYGSLDKLPKSLNALRNAIASYQAKAGDSYAMHNRYYAATARIAAALDAATTPTKQNGGQQISAQSWVVGYTPDKLPTANQLIGSLNTAGNALEVVINLNDFTEESVQMSLSGGFEFPIPIGELFDISIGASASYDLSRYALSSTSVTMNMTYPGVTVVSTMPSRLSADNKTGWYANDILEEVATKTGQDATGYKLQGSEYDIDDLFGPGMAFSRLKTFVISQQPTIEMTFTGTELSRVTSDFKVGASIKLQLFGLFTLGEAEGSYAVHNVQVDSKTGTVKLTFGPPKVSGTTPLEKQVAYVLGGVASYPPDNI